MSNKPTPKKDALSALIVANSGTENIIAVNRFYVDLTGGLETALLLSQIVYWSDRATMTDGWFAKTYEDWREEICISEYQVRKATKTLADFGVETKLKKFNGSPTVHYRLKIDMLSDSIRKYFSFDSEETSETITETTTETTEKTLCTSDDALHEPLYDKPAKPGNCSDKQYDGLRPTYALNAAIGNSYFADSEISRYRKIANHLLENHITVDQFTDYVSFVKRYYQARQWEFRWGSLDKGENITAWKADGCQTNLEQQAPIEDDIEWVNPSTRPVIEYTEATQ